MLELRTIFNSAAKEYEAVRPGYPETLVEDIVCLSAVPAGGRVLEVGCGTGQATLPFAQRGYKLLCLDIGPDLLSIASQKLHDFPNVRFRRTSFEQWPARLGYYDLVISATAFHWIPKEVGFPKAALVLKPGGSLAVFSNEHPRPFSGFFQEVQSVYKQVVPEWDDPRDRQPIEQEIQAKAAYIDSTGLFKNPITVRTYPWQQTYSTSDYLRLINTYSGNRALDEGRRRSLYQGIAEIIERRYGGQVEKQYLAVLFLGQKP